MLAPADLTRLRQAPTAQAVPLYLHLMIKHHQGAIDMSWALLDGGGQNVFIHSVAKHVINEQTAENSAMTDLLPEVLGRARPAAGVGAVGAAGGPGARGHI
jgi:uncharacterized protein (DUF305 family)